MELSQQLKEVDYCNLYISNIISDMKKFKGEVARSVSFQAISVSVYYHKKILRTLELKIEILRTFGAED